MLVIATYSEATTSDFHPKVQDRHFEATTRSLAAQIHEMPLGLRNDLASYASPLRQQSWRRDHGRLHRKRTSSSWLLEISFSGLRNIGVISDEKKVETDQKPTAMKTLQRPEIALLALVSWPRSGPDNSHPTS
jgi:hypothetical protein